MKLILQSDYTERSNLLILFINLIFSIKCREMQGCVKEPLLSHGLHITTG